MALMRAIGLMSGTSMDGIDVALIETDGETIVRRSASAEYSYEAAFRRDLAESLEAAKAIKRRTERPGILTETEREITDRHGQAVNRFLEENSIDRATIDVVGFHGQTVLHRPEVALTVQLGDGNLLSNLTSSTSSTICGPMT